MSTCTVTIVSSVGYLMGTSRKKHVVWSRCGSVEGDLTVLSFHQTKHEWLKYSSTPLHENEFWRRPGAIWRMQCPNHLSRAQTCAQVALQLRPFWRFVSFLSHQFFNTPPQMDLQFAHLERIPNAPVLLNQHKFPRASVVFYSSRDTPSPRLLTPCLSVC